MLAYRRLPFQGLLSEVKVVNPPGVSKPWSIEMGEILGIGITHYPGLISPDEDRAFPLTRTLLSDRIPSEVKDPATWPEAMRTEYSDDQGIAAARMHRDRLVAGFRQQEGRTGTPSIPISF